jgi:hypothetical protein
MKYLKVCDTMAQQNELSYALRQIGAACKRFGELAGLPENSEPNGRAFYRGQSRVHCEYDAIYWRLEDSNLAIYLACLPEFEGRFRDPRVVRIFEQY